MSSPTEFFIYRFLLGVAEAGFFPGVLFYLTLWAPKSRRSMFTAVFMSALTVSGMIGGPLGGFIMHNMDGYRGLQGWQWVFIFESLPTVVLAIITYYTLANQPSEAQWLSGREKAIVAHDLEEENATKDHHKHGSPLAALRDKRFYMMATMAFALVSGLGALSIWAPTVIRESGIDNVAIVGLMSGIPFVFGMVAQFSGAWHSDKTQERRWHAALPALLAATGWLLLPLAKGNPTLSIVVLVVIAGGSFGATAPFWTIPSLFLTGKTAAVGIATVTTFGSLGGLVSPTIVGFLTDRSGSLAVGLSYYGVLLIIGSTVLLIGTRSLADSARKSASADPSTSR